MHDVMRFWLARGVDGFRVDVMWHLIKDDAFRDNPPNPDYRTGDPPYRRLLPLYSADRPEVHEVVRGLRAVIDEFPERVLIGEIYLPVEKLVAYYGRDLAGVHLPFNFACWKRRGAPRPSPNWSNATRRRCRRVPGRTGYWAITTGCGLRSASGRSRRGSAAMLLLTLRGTPTLYYGDEIGMRQVPIPVDRVRDPAAAHVPGRDGARTPMQWDASAHAGFSAVEPWLPLADDFAGTNAAAERADPGSLLNLYRRLLAVRRTRPALTQGAYRSIAAAGEVLTYDGR